MAARKPEDVAFAAEYADGSTEIFWIDPSSLRAGDHVARIIADERQREGEMREGAIVSVKRAPFEHIPYLSISIPPSFQLPLQSPIHFLFGGLLVLAVIAATLIAYAYIPAFRQYVDATFSGG
jgi:hypothetical protein